MLTLTLPTPAKFRFWVTVRGHGWSDLPPFGLDMAAQSLSRVLHLPDGLIVRCVISAADERATALEVQVTGVERLSRTQTDAITRMLRRCLDMDRDLTDLYALIHNHPRLAWIENLGAGRLLSSPTVWEDLVKTLMTTNTTWAMTIQMVTRIAALGDPVAGGGHAFPTPQQLAALSLDELSGAVRAGYRNAYLYELATRIASGELEVESWRDADLPSAELLRRIKALKGFGDYAAGNLLRLLGHFDRLATDTVCRAVYQERINGGIAAQHDREIAAYYEPFGRWRGLVQWMDVMELTLVSA